MQGFARTAVSAVILLLIGVQIAASFGFLDRFRYWPFLSYPMYNHAHEKGDAVARLSLVGIDADGKEVPIRPEDLKLDFWRYLRGPVRAAQKNDARGLLSYLEHFEHRARTRFVSIRLENRPVALIDGKLTDLPVESSLIVVRES
jgi:hypothetical protein